MYLLDADVLIQAKNLHYGFDIAPGFWDWILDAHSRRQVYTVEQIKQEIDRGQDELTDWLGRTAPASFVLPYEAADQGPLSRLMSWATGYGFNPAAVSKFSGSGDLFLVAKAAARGWTVISHETQADPNAKVRVKIPNACLEVGVDCIGLFEAMRRGGVVLHL